MVTANTTLQDLFNEACNTAHTIVQPNEVFIVRDLFRAVEWNRIDISTRKTLGSMFYAYVLGVANNDFAPLDKTAQKQQRYTKLPITITT